MPAFGQSTAHEHSAMERIDPLEIDRFLREYRKRSDDDLLRLIANSSQLLPAARIALETVVGERGIADGQIETNTQEGPIASCLVYGSTRRRFVAHLIDFYFAGLGLIFALILLVKYESGAAAATILGFTFFPLYMLISEGLFHGTPGKCLLGLQVRCAEEGHPRAPFSRLLLRETIGRFLSETLFGMGYWRADVKPFRQAWSDQIARTVVIRTSPPRWLRICLAGFIPISLVFWLVLRVMFARS